MVYRTIYNWAVYNSDRRGGAVVSRSFVILAKVPDGIIVGNQRGQVNLVKASYAASVSKHDANAWNSLLQEGWSLLKAPTYNGPYFRLALQSEIRPYETVAHCTLSDKETEFTWLVKLQPVLVGNYVITCGCAAHHKVWVVMDKAPIIVRDNVEKTS